MRDLTIGQFDLLDTLTTCPGSSADLAAELGWTVKELGPRIGLLRRRGYAAGGWYATASGLRFHEFAMGAGALPGVTPGKAVALACKPLRDVIVSVLATQASAGRREIERISGSSPHVVGHMLLRMNRRGEVRRDGELWSLLPRGVEIWRHIVCGTAYRLPPSSISMETVALIQRMGSPTILDMARETGIHRHAMKMRVKVAMRRGLISRKKGPDRGFAYYVGAAL